MVFKNLCILVLWMKVAGALERLNIYQDTNYFGDLSCCGMRPAAWWQGIKRDLLPSLLKTWPNRMHSSLSCSSNDVYSPNLISGSKCNNVLVLLTVVFVACCDDDVPGWGYGLATGEQEEGMSREVGIIGFHVNSSHAFAPGIWCFT